MTPEAVEMMREYGSMPEGFEEREDIYAPTPADDITPELIEQLIRCSRTPMARSTMARARKNIERLVSRLYSMGSEFRCPRFAEDWRQPAVFVPPRPDAVGRIVELEARAGMLPLSLRAWYEVVGSVDLTGQHPDHPDFETSYPDPLVVTPIKFALSEFAAWQSLRQEEGRQEVGPFCIDIAPDYYHKAEGDAGSERAWLAPAGGVA